MSYRKKSGEPSRERLDIRVSRETKQRITEAAARAGVTLSEYVETAALERAERESHPADR